MLEKNKEEEKNKDDDEEDGYNNTSSGRRRHWSPLEEDRLRYCNYSNAIIDSQPR